LKPSGGIGTSVSTISNRYPADQDTRVFEELASTALTAALPADLVDFNAYKGKELLEVGCSQHRPDRFAGVAHMLGRDHFRGWRLTWPASTSSGTPARRLRVMNGEAMLSGP
jgi:hypothetical protein